VLHGGIHWSGAVIGTQISRTLSQRSYDEAVTIGRAMNDGHQDPRHRNTVRGETQTQYSGDETGVVAQEAFSQITGLPWDKQLRPGGDGGTDFWCSMGNSLVPIDLKARETNGYKILIRASDLKPNQIYIGASVDHLARTVYFDGWIIGRDVPENSVKNVSSKDVQSLNYEVKKSSLQKMSDLHLDGCPSFPDDNILSPGSLAYFMDGSFLRCRLPSGRLLSYLYPEVHTRVTWRFKALNARGKPVVISFPSKIGVPTWRARNHAEHLASKQGKVLLDESPENFISPHLSFMGRNTVTHQWQRCGTHGGSLVENGDQASSRDLLAESMLRVDEMDDFDLLLSIHDEVIAEAPIGSATCKEFEDIMAIVPWWAPGMPIAAEGWIGPRLRK